MIRLVTLVALASLLAMASPAQASNTSPPFVEECHDAALDPLDNQQRWTCRFALSDAHVDTLREVEKFVDDLWDTPRLNDALP